MIFMKESKGTWDINASYAKADGDANLASPPGGAPFNSLGQPVAAASLPNADETDLVTAKTSFTYKFNKRARVTAAYWFERYLIDDYAEKTIQADLVKYGSILLNAIQPNYQYHVGWIGLIYNW